MEVVNEYYPDPIYVVAADSALRQLEDLKNKFQGKINWRQFNK